jgi:hypothetical protein
MRVSIQNTRESFLLENAAALVNDGRSTLYHVPGKGFIEGFWRTSDLQAFNKLNEVDAEIWLRDLGELTPDGLKFLGTYKMEGVETE